MIVALAMSIFLIGAVGLAVDGAHLYSQRQMAQATADSAAIAAMMSIFDGTNGAGATGFVSTPGSTFTCSTTDARTPCVYAKNNGFGGSASDTVTIDFPASPTTAAPGVNFASTYPTVLVRATVTRNVNATLMRLVGAGATTAVTAKAMAAIIDVMSPVPILVNHPTKSDSLHTNGGVNVQILGGPARSIEVNSSSTTAVTTAGSGTVDLSLAGPTGNGADFGVWGGPTTQPFIFNPGTLPGKYLPSASWMRDPLENVAPPDPATLPTAPAPTTLANGVNGCPAGAKKQCYLYSPGIYPLGIDGKNSVPVFQPGIYYIQSTAGMLCNANCDMYMATAGVADPAPPSGTGTGWTGNMLVYNTGPTGNPTNAGPISLGANGSISLVGSPSGSAYKGILFFQNRASIARTHSLGGGGDLTLVGTIYMTNTRATMLGDASHFQELDLQGNPGSATNITGEIITDVLGLGGNAGITMNLSAIPSLFLSQVALVN
jgi:hypothetical protein